MAKQKFELSKLDVNELAELDGWKTKMETLVQENPFVEIKDRETYEEAKKRRTALKSGRTEVQKQDKTIGSFLREFRSKTKAIGESFIAIVQPAEEKQQAEIDRHEAILEEQKLAKEREEEQRVQGIKDRVDNLKEQLKLQIEMLTFENLEESSSVFDDIVADGHSQDFEEFQILFDDVATEMSIQFEEAVQRVKQSEIDRLEGIKKTEEALLDRIELWSIKRIDEAQPDEVEILRDSVTRGIDSLVRDQKFTEGRENKFKTIVESISNKIELKITSLKADAERDKKMAEMEEQQRHQNEVNEQRANINQMREGWLDLIFQMTPENFEETKSYLEKRMANKDNLFPELESEFDSSVKTAQRSLNDKISHLEKEIQRQKEEEARLEAEAEKVLENAQKEAEKRQNLLIVEYGFERLPDGMVENKSIDKRYDHQFLIDANENEWKNQLDLIIRDIQGLEENKQRQERIEPEKQEFIGMLNKMLQDLVETPVDFSEEFEPLANCVTDNLQEFVKMEIEKIKQF